MGNEIPSGFLQMERPGELPRFWSFDRRISFVRVGVCERPVNSFL
jgi:hypothetical protein